MGVLATTFHPCIKTLRRVRRVKDLLMYFIDVYFLLMYIWPIFYTNTNAYWCIYTNSLSRRTIPPIYVRVIYIYISIYYLLMYIYIYWCIFEDIYTPIYLYINLHQFLLNSLTCFHTSTSCQDTTLWFPNNLPNTRYTTKVATACYFHKEGRGPDLMDSFTSSNRLKLYTLLIIQFFCEP